MKNLLLTTIAARRFAERGVRFIELIHTGSSGNWDSHGDMMDHEHLAKQVDRPYLWPAHRPQTTWHV